MPEQERYTLLDSRNEAYFGNGRFRVQLELPPDSTLTGGDIERILSICSCDGDINPQIEGREGGRSVLISRAQSNIRNGIEESGLQISGVVYNEPTRPNPDLPYFGQGRRSTPPQNKNFLLQPEGQGMGTTGVKNEKVTRETRGYSPIGSYTQKELVEKVKATQLIDQLGLSFGVPHIEAYGRYLPSSGLSHKREPFGFIISTIPSAQLKRFMGQSLEHLARDARLETAVDYFWNIGKLIGAAAGEMHEAGYIHRQLQLSNFYHIEKQDKLYIVDWATMEPLTGSRRNQAMQRGIDIVLPLQEFDEYVNTIFTSLPPDMKTQFLNGLFYEQMTAYSPSSDAFADRIFAYYKAGQGGKLIDVLEVLLKKDLHFFDKQ